MPINKGPESSRNVEIMSKSISSPNLSKIFQRGHAGVVNCLTLNEDSTVCLSGSIDGSVKCWDMRSKSQEPIQVLEEMKDSVTCILGTNHLLL